jgi:mannose-6-phosphate isomerase-like protein (cupin superfamily)
MLPINLLQKFDLINDYWHPRIVGELNGQLVKLAKLKGQFVWHAHAEEDELFYIVKGTLKIEFRDKTVSLQAGEMLVVPKGVEHNPVAEEEVWVMLFEPAATKHTGEVQHQLTRTKQEWI